ncbi:hypothetical protein CONLIGDRAFT_634690 [Coniochaeta ligniaria NRRL 30616]|uniref:Uncharacterized protein n=1 Tax=Coniochaeta ligniaria NRRL 30616 TaxID=1408157 RepID=A0A1J7IGJ7_9PEZI|nr:hypothetical protein CONLIGDRAFT_634690 [Coniochaeta ligniaria NRRL 30616]
MISVILFLAAWDREEEAAYKAVEEVWGQRGALAGRRPDRKELMGWYARYLAQKGSWNVLDLHLAVISISPEKRYGRRFGL